MTDPVLSAKPILERFRLDGRVAVEVSDFMTGQDMIIDGGYSCW